ncbi:N-acetylmuramoyl-L-alanine amidase family protein [Thermus aquaticus]|uniref:N-acetylmuramoyl-L-alanine amidase n=1 Tax=Thermus aquaticus (strain ATCC BAA-2747 / Y51MC23) TaxID=498848 RepID=A0ABM5VLX2_THEA5|nr:N-acetylmuramoyl-L-alanine amidase [Thermus aquaticus]ALJ90953.1 N-acetylmuramoyl-L-alanine amidase [Thermus aquaticus Y51MC23]
MRLWLLFLWGLALAQAPKPLKVGALTGEALYPGGRGVAYGEARLVAQGLGLSLWQGGGQVALGLGSRVQAFPVVAEEARAATGPSAWRQGDKVYVPLRPLAEALGLEYRAREGILLNLPWARLLGVERGQGRLLLRFSREVNAVVREGGVLFLLAQGEGEGLRQEALGLFLPLESPPDRLYYPGGNRVALEWGPLPRPRPLVLLDPGHGGQDPGMTFGDLKEKDLALDLARRVAARLPGSRLTRTGDETLPLEARLEKAREAGVLISFHLTQGSALNLYLPKGRTSPLAKSAEALLASVSKERAGLLKAYAGDPRLLAKALEEALGALGLVVAKAEGPYALLDIPGAGVILEVGVERLKTPEAKEALAQAIAHGVRAYLEGP